MEIYEQKELEDMFETFLTESGFYDWEWTYGMGNLKKNVLIWGKGTPHQDILDWFDNHFEDGLNEYIKTQWEFWLDEVDICADCPKLIDCSNCTFENPFKKENEMFEFYDDDEHVNKLQVYIEENFTLDGTSKHLIRNILDYVAAQVEDDTSLDMLETLLNGIGIDREEIINAVIN